jgi:DNA-directed RNA polymerase subunit RPC12/RpoP
MPDNLKKLSDSLDSKRAQKHKLTGKPVVPERSAMLRYVCSVCHRPDSDPEAVKLLSWSVCMKCGGKLIEMSL